uniref:Cytochrome c oxidase subunit 7B, mitochondrial n=1 Tax=Ailuropoda melanoleuca TaxID=9646 RepID=A0A7N5JFR9_AILME
MARWSHHKWTPDFDDQYGNTVLASEATFYVAVWAQMTTQSGIEWNLPPKEWRGQQSVVPADVMLNCFKTNS